MFIYGFPGDALRYVYSYWLGSQGLLQSIFPPQLVTFYFLKFNIRFFGIIDGYNLSILLAFILAFICSYALSHKYMESSPAVLVSLAYTSSSYYTWHGMQNVEIILAAAFLPIFFLALLDLEDHLNEKTGFLSSVAFASIAFTLVFLSSFYLGYFSLIFSVVFFFVFRLADWWLRGKSFATKKIIFAYFSFACLSFFLTLPATYQLWQYFLGGLGDQGIREIEGGLWRNSRNDLIAYGSRPWDYLMPSIYHPFFGSLVRDFYWYLKINHSYQYWSVFLPERSNYLTLTLLVLSFYGLIKFARKEDKSSRDQGNIIVVSLMIVVMFLVSMPALVTLKGFSFPMPSYFLFQIFPMFRVYARAGIFVLLGVSILAGYGLEFFIKEIKQDRFNLSLGRLKLGGRKSVLITVTLCGFVLFENLNLPPLAVMDVSKAPQVYEWIKNQPGKLKIIEYPKDNSVVDIGGGCPSWLDPNVVRDYNGAYESFYQIFHAKDVLASDVLTKEERTLSADLTKSGSYEVLKRHNVDYAVVHTKDPMIGIHQWPYPQENPLDECWQRRIMKKPEKVYEKFKLVAEFDDGLVYELQ